MQGISDLDSTPTRVRVHSVITRDNVNEVSELIALCEEHPCVVELKLFDVSQYSELWHGRTSGAKYWLEKYVSLGPIQERIASEYKFIGTAYSVGGYGSPMPVFETPSGLRIRVRRSDGGACYGSGCKECPAYASCGDGHCNLELGPNRLIKVCRPKEGRVFRIGQERQAVEYFRMIQRQENEVRRQHLSQFEMEV
jgi:cyclic pyranopterin phosphate synthase